MKELIKKAHQFAVKKHEGQMYGDIPYICHLFAAVHNLYPNPTQEAIAACWLHDIVEDTDTTREDIQREFGYGVALIVWAVTDGKEETRAQRKRGVYNKIRKAGTDAAIVKTADRMANIQYSFVTKNTEKLKMYCKEDSEFRANVGNVIRHFPIWKRYCRLMKDVSEVYYFKLNLNEEAE